MLVMLRQPREQSSAGKSTDGNSYPPRGCRREDPPQPCGGHREVQRQLRGGQRESLLRPPAPRPRAGSWPQRWSTSSSCGRGREEKNRAK